MPRQIPELPPALHRGRCTGPVANPSLYFSMSLAMTFPFNIVAGIPLYHGVVQQLWN